MSESQDDLASTFIRRFKAAVEKFGLGVLREFLPCSHLRWDLSCGLPESSGRFAFGTHARANEVLAYFLLDVLQLFVRLSASLGCCCASCGAMPPSKYIYVCDWNTKDGLEYLRLVSVRQDVMHMFFCV